MHVGRELERARLNRGESLEDVSARTSINVERLSAIERQDLGELPSLISVKGYVHAFAVAVGLDPDDVAARYTAQFDTQVTLSEFESEGPLLPDEPSRARLSSDSSSSPWRRSQPMGRASTAEGGIPKGRLLQVIDDRAAPPTRGGPYFGRGRSARPRRGGSRISQAMLVAVLAVTVGFAAAATVDRLSRNTLDASAVAQSSGVVASFSSGPAHAGDVARVVRDASRTDEGEDADDNTPTDLNGGWTFTSRVESNDSARTQVTVGYRLRLKQRGVNVSGTGYRATENGRIIPLRQRTPIAVEGTLDGRRLELLFTERVGGATSAGTLVMRVASQASMRGTFWTDSGAQNRGSAYARRVAQ